MKRLMHGLAFLPWFVGVVVTVVIVDLLAMVNSSTRKTCIRVIGPCSSARARRKRLMHGFAFLLWFVGVVVTVDFFAMSDSNGSTARTEPLVNSYSGHIGCDANGCSGTMHLRENGSKELFYACSNYPRCRAEIGQQTMEASLSPSLKKNLWPPQKSFPIGYR